MIHKDVLQIYKQIIYTQLRHCHSVFSHNILLSQIRLVESHNHKVVVGLSLLAFPNLTNVHILYSTVNDCVQSNDMYMPLSFRCGVK